MHGPADIGSAWAYSWPVQFRGFYLKTQQFTPIYQKTHLILCIPINPKYKVCLSLNLEHRIKEFYIFYLYEK